MTQLRLETYHNRTTFAPGALVEGIASWELERTPRSVELRLIWYTQGKGDRAVETAQVRRFENPQSTDSQIFELMLPRQPYSFSGKLISLIWALELVVEPGNFAQRLEIVVAPAGREVDIARTAEDRRGAPRWLARFTR